MKRLLSILICLIMIFPLFTFDVNAGKATVVYLRNNGNGDGSSYTKAVGSLTDAYDALDLSKDCTIVVCNDFNQTAGFTYGKPYTGSVTFTSVYNGVDYKTKYGAEYISPQQRFVCYGETIFDDIDLRVTGNYFFIIANCNPITLTENFNPKYLKKVSGNVVDSGVSILGGYQNGQDMYPLECYNDINITVMGGKNICIIAYNRAVKYGYHFGTANITVGGAAHVGTLRFTSIDADDLICGNVDITIKDSAKVDYIRTGNGQNLDLDSVLVNWQGGKIGQFIKTENREIDGVSVKTTEITDGSWLRYSSDVRKESNFKSIMESFDNAVLIGSPDDTYVPTKTEIPADVGSKVTDEPVTPAETAEPIGEDTYDISPIDGDATDWESVIIIAASALIAASLIIIVIILRKK